MLRQAADDVTAFAVRADVPAAVDEQRRDGRDVHGLGVAAIDGRRRARAEPCSGSSEVWMIASFAMITHRAGCFRSCRCVGCVQRWR
jgi:hypothetical protein